MECTRKIFARTYKQVVKIWRAKMAAMYKMEFRCPEEQRYGGARSGVAATVSRQTAAARPTKPDFNNTETAT